MLGLSKHLIRDRSGSTAVELALVAPLLFALVFGIVAYGSIISVNNGLQQIVAEAARASVAGLSDTERAQLAQASVTTGTPAYAFIDPTRMTLFFDSPSPSSFRVSITYDMSKMIAYSLLTWLPLPPAQVTRKAVIQRGGF